MGPLLSARPQVPSKEPGSLLGAIVGGCLGAAILTLGIVAMVAMARSWWAEAKVYAWSEGVATILQARASAPPRAYRDPSISVRFQYTYAGHTYESERVDARSSVRHPEAFQLATLWRPGSNWPCYIDPGNPQIAVLRRDSLWWGFGVLVPLAVGGGMGGLFLYAAWRSLRPEGDPARVSSPLGARRAVRQIATVLLVVSLLVVTYFTGVRPLLLFESATHWRAVPCTIVASRARAHSNGMRTGYSVQVVFRYPFDGRQWASGEYELDENNGRSYQDAAGIVNRYPPGAVANCYLDPTSPDRAVLDRSWPVGMAWGLLPLGFLLAVTWRLVASARRRKRARAPRP
jgi:hypothetical protein